MSDVLPTGPLAVWGGTNWAYPWSQPGYFDRPGTSSCAPSGGQGRPRNGTGIAALVVGIAALVLAVSFFPLGLLLGILSLVLGVLALVLGLVALVLGIVGLRRANRGEATNKGQAVAGLTTGAMAIVVVGVLAVFIGSFLFQTLDGIGNVTDCITNADTPQAEQACLERFLQNPSD